MRSAAQANDPASPHNPIDSSACNTDSFAIDSGAPAFPHRVPGVIPLMARWNSGPSTLDSQRANSDSGLAIESADGGVPGGNSAASSCSGVGSETRSPQADHTWASASDTTGRTTIPTARRVASPIRRTERNTALRRCGAQRRFSSNTSPCAGMKRRTPSAPATQ